jgi:hypothetical protein
MRRLRDERGRLLALLEDIMDSGAVLSVAIAGRITLVLGEVEASEWHGQ